MRSFPTLRLLTPPQSALPQLPACLPGTPSHPPNACGTGATGASEPSPGASRLPAYKAPSSQRGQLEVLFCFTLAFLTASGSARSARPLAVAVIAKVTPTHLLGSELCSLSRLLVLLRWAAARPGSWSCPSRQLGVPSAAPPAACTALPRGGVSGGSSGRLSASVDSGRKAGRCELRWRFPPAGVQSTAQPSLQDVKIVCLHFFHVAKSVSPDMVL